jgi:hypothetical protein
MSAPTNSTHTRRLNHATYSRLEVDKTTGLMTLYGAIRCCPSPNGAMVAFHPRSCSNPTQAPAITTAWLIGHVPPAQSESVGALGRATVTRTGTGLNLSNLPDLLSQLYILRTTVPTAVTRLSEGENVTEMMRVAKLR